MRTEAEALRLQPRLKPAPSPSHRPSLLAQSPSLRGGVAAAGVAPPLTRVPGDPVGPVCSSRQKTRRCCPRHPRDACGSLGMLRGCCYNGQEGSPRGVNPALPLTRVRAPIGNARASETSREPLWSGLTHIRKAFVSIPDARDEAAPVRCPALSDEGLGGPFTASTSQGTWDCPCVHTHLGKQAPCRGPLRTG